MSDQSESDPIALKQSLVISQLSGCTWAINFLHKSDANRAINQLATCDTHHGVHHFAVVGEGQTLAMSRAGRECLITAGLLPDSGWTS